MGKCSGSIQASSFRYIFFFLGQIQIFTDLQPTKDLFDFHFSLSFSLRFWNIWVSKSSCVFGNKSLHCRIIGHFKVFTGWMHIMKKADGVQTVVFGDLNVLRPETKTINLKPVMLASCWIFCSSIWCSDPVFLSWNFLLPHLPGSSCPYFFSQLSEYPFLASWPGFTSSVSHWTW